MRLLSWTNLYISSSMTCATCLAGPTGGQESHDNPVVLEKRKLDSRSAPSSIGDDDSAPTTTVLNTRKQGATRTGTRTATTRVPRETSKVTRTYTAANTKTLAASEPESTRTAPPATSPSRSRKGTSSTFKTSIFLTSTSSYSAATPTTSTSSLLSPTNLSQSTPVVAPSPQPQPASRVSTEGIVVGVVLGVAFVVGVVWITFAKWRESKRYRAAFGHQEIKRGFGGGSANEQYSSSQDSLLIGGKPVESAKDFELKSLSLLAREYSFRNSYHRPSQSIPQDVLPVSSPVQARGLQHMQQEEQRSSSRVRGHRHVDEMQYPYGQISSVIRVPGGSVTRKALPQVHFSSPVHVPQRPSGHERSPLVELPG